MKRIEDGFFDALLADVVYVDGVSANLAADSLVKVVSRRVTRPLAEAIGKRFEVAAAYDGPLTDYQGVLFRDRNDGTLYLAHRGTAGGRDLIADIDLALVSGVARDQVAAMVNWWNSISLPAGTSYRLVNSVPVNSTDPRTFVDGGAASAKGTIAAEVAAASAAGKLRVVGHSLGGHLTTVFASLFHDQVSHSSTFNGAGLFSTPTLSATFAKILLGTPLQQAAQLIGKVPRLPDASTQDNFYAANGVNFTTNDFTFVQRGARIPVYNEYKSELSLSPFSNHSQYKLTDSLALFNAFEKLAPGVGLDALAAIAERGANVQAASLEATLDALRKALSGPAIAPTPPSDDGGDWKNGLMPRERIAYHSNLVDVQASSAFGELAGKLEIAPTAARGAGALAVDARADFGSFVALRDLSAFALQPKAGAAGAKVALDGAWQFGRGGEHAAWLADASARVILDAEATLNFTDAWYADRATMLEWHLRRNLADGPPPEAQRVAGAWRFDDRITGTAFDIASPRNAYPLWSKIAFGRDDIGESLAGDAQRDRIYGGGGADTVVGNAGDDYLEGNAGSDMLDGGLGNDELLGGADNDRLDGGGGDDRLDGGQGADRADGGAGNDRLFGGPGSDVLAGGAGHDRITGDAGDDELDGGAGGDRLEGGAGNDRYRFAAGDGDDRLDDSDGKGRIELAGTVLAGGAAVAPGLWRNAGVSYAFVPDADGRGELVITSGSQRIVVEGFRPGINGGPGDLGIALADYVAPAVGTYNVVAGTAGDDNGLDHIAGHNPLTGTTNADRIQGLGGRDQLLGNLGNDLLEGGAQGDVLSGGDGDDRLFADALVDLKAFAEQQARLPGTALQGDWLDGGYGNDELVGGVDADALFAGRGDDRVFGGAGNDFIFGDGEGAATDLGWHRVDGADHSYTLLPANYVLPSVGGADFIRAGGGDDIVNADRGDDIVFGEGGNDIIAGYEGADRLSGGDGNDAIAGDESGWFGVPDALGAADIIDGGPGADVLRGNGGDDVITGGDGDDVIDGGDGDDDIEAGQGVDNITGGAGSDRIAAGLGDDVVSGGNGADIIAGDDGADQMLGDADNDRLDGGAGDDVIVGGDGDDLLAGGEGGDVLVGDAGADVMSGGVGDDGLWGGDGADALDGGAGNDRVAGGAGDDELAAGEGSDALWGEAGADMLAGGIGDDRIAGGNDNDVLAGDAGDDALWGDAGDDALDGGAGRDWLDGGVGNDALFGGSESDGLVGGEGDDTLDGGAASDLLQGGAGNDTYIIDSSGDADIIADSEGNNTYRLPTGVTLDNLDLWLGSDPTGDASHLVVVHGGRTLAVILDGYDPGAPPGLVLADGHVVSRWEMLSRLAQHVDPGLYATPVSTTPPSGNATYVDGQYKLAMLQAAHPRSFVPINIPGSRYMGGDGPDRYTAVGAGAQLSGGPGNDTLVGEYADDTLRGDAGDDTLSGERGNDVIEGGAGDDQLSGGLGADRLDGGDGADTLDGEFDEDTLVGGPGNDTLRGGTNRDRLQGDDGDDILSGGDANDVLAGGAGADALFGEIGNDDLDGGVGNDVLDGGEGSDTLAGGAGDDMLRGGVGDDTYIVDGAGIDRMQDSGGGSVIRFAAGITETSFTLRRGAVGTADADALILDFGTGRTLTLEGGMRASVARFEFADGRAWTLEQLLDARYVGALSLAANAGQRLLSGGPVNDDLTAAATSGSHLIGGRGDDTLRGAAGADRLDGGAGIDTLNAAAGDDLVQGGDGDDMLAGDVGADLLRGGAGNDRLDGGAGDDRLFGEAGDDVYLVSAGGGQDIVDDAAGRNSLRLASSIAPATVAYRHDASDLLIALPDGAKTWVRGGWAQDRVSSIAFGDGSSLSIAQVRARAQPLLAGEALSALGQAPVFGTIGNDTLTGFEPFGDAGDDLLQGGRIHFGRGDGADTLLVDPTADPTRPPSRVVELAPGLAVDDLLISRSGDDLVIAIRGTRDQLTVREHFKLVQVSMFGPPTTPAALAELRFADGTALQRSEIAALAYATSSRNDDAVNVGSGGEGDDRIRLIGESREVRGGDGGDTLEADPRLPQDLSSLFGDAGDDRLYAGRGFASETLLDGGNGDDILFGAASATLIGGSGRNRLVVGTGPATNAFVERSTGGSLPALPGGSRPQQLVLERDGGIDLVTQQDASLGGERQDAFTVKISARDYRDLSVQRDNQDLVLGVRGRSAAMTIPDFFAAGSGHAGLQGMLVIETEPHLGVKYIGSSSPDAATLAARAQTRGAAALDRTGSALGDDLVGAGGNDRLSGMAGDDRLDGLSGDDALSGGSGNDVLIGRSGNDTLGGDDGEDTLFGGYGDDRLDGGADADALADVAGNNVLDGGPGNDSLRAGGGSNTMRGGDGDDMIVSLAGTNVVQGGAGNDWINFVSGSADIDAGAGNDWIGLSGTGNVTLRFGRGSGRDRVDGSSGGFAAGVDAEIVFGPGISPADIVFATQFNAGLQAEDVILDIAGTTDRLTLEGAIRNGVAKVGALRFESGTALRVTDLTALPRSGTAGNDTLIGTPGNDSQSGLAGSDRLQGLAGNDRLDGGPGSDFMEGGAGDDVYIVDDRGDVVVESDAQGRDTGGVDEILASVNVMMPRYVERLTLTGSDPLSAWGSTGNDLMTGNAGDNALDGGLGADRMAGGTGNDAYFVDDAGDVIVEAAGAGRDVVFATVSHALADNVEVLRQTADVPLTGTGNELANELLGGPAANMLVGRGGDDLLDGAGGADTMQGGAGDDLYIVDDAGDLIVEAAGEGNDSVQSWVSLTLADGVENLQLLSDAGGSATGNALDNRLVGTYGNDRLDGGAGADVLEGLLGTDTYVLRAGGGVDRVLDIPVGSDLAVVAVASGLGPADIRIDRDDSDGSPTLVVSLRDGSAALRFVDFGATPYDLVVQFADGSVWGSATVRARIGAIEGTSGSDLLVGRPGADRLIGLAGDDLLRGGDGDDVLEGGDGADTLDGESGADTLQGGPGDDRYLQVHADDTVIEADGGGDDEVEAAASLALPAGVETLVLTGTTAIDGSGNELDNRIVGNAAANVLDGGIGVDVTEGGDGDDTHLVDASLDVVVERPGEGVDTVIATQSYVLPAEVEHLALAGWDAIDATGNGLDNTITGNAQANRLDGGLGADTLRGGEGDDVYVVDNLGDLVAEWIGEGDDAVFASVNYVLPANLETLTLQGGATSGTGNAVGNALNGNAAANLLDGGAGADTMSGGAGDDTYRVDNVWDAVVESAAAGSDTVVSSVSYVLPVNVEALLLDGAAAINGTGNAGANRLTGNVAGNVLNGGAGNDVLAGGAGNDTYVVDAAGDTIFESAGGGTDSVQASLNWTLAAELENLTLTGAAAINGTGNAVANRLTGNAAANVLDGGAGSDVLAGGAGNDSYVVDAAGDTIVESAGGGSDSVQASLSWTLAAELENLTLTGTAAINGTGNALANVLSGNAAANRLDGGGGADRLQGGAGNDVYVVDHAGDVVVESASAGEDAVLSSVAHTLAADVEHLTLTGTTAINGSGNALANTIAGNDAANTLSGGDGGDLLWGAAGNDTLAGGNGNDALQGGAGDDVVGDASGNGLLDGGIGNDALTGGAGRELFVGGAGADTITTGGGADVIAFNRGAGADVVNASLGSDDTLTLGGGIRYADLRLRKTGLDLVLDAGAGDQITLRNWYQAGVNQKSVVTLQALADAMSGYNAAGADRMLNRRVVRFDFAGLVTRFDAAVAANPALSSYALAGALADFYVAGSDTAAIGGDLAYDYGHRNALTDIGVGAAQAVLGASGFGTTAQTLQAASTLYAGTQRLR